MPTDTTSTASRPRRRLWPWLAALASGALLVICFPPMDLSGLAFLALSPLLWALWRYRPVRRPWIFRFFAGYLCGVVYFTGCFWWIGELGPLYESEGLRFLSLGLSVYLSLYPAVWALFAGWLVGDHFHVEPPDPLKPFSRPPLLSSLRNLGIAAALAAAWTALEWVRGWLMTGFGWDTLGVALHEELALIQITEFTGVGGLSFLLVFCNAIAVITILRLRAEIGRTRLRPHFDFALTVALVVLVFLYGVRTLPRDEPFFPVAPVPHSAKVVFPREPHPSGPVLRVAAVQPNIPQIWKFRRDPLDPDSDPWEKIRDITAKRHLVATYGRAESVGFLWDPIWLHHARISVLLKPHLVVWPEAAVPLGVLRVEENIQYMEKLLEGVPALLMGTDDIGRNGPGDDHNSAALFINGTLDEERNVYDKMHLVPFGEYLPLRPLFRWLPENMQNGDFQRGTEHKVFDLPDPGVKLGPSICFEDTDGDLTRQPVLMGAQILVNVTNDGWFGKSSGSAHHLYNAIFRAVENRRPLVRACNTGMTCLVDAYGRVHQWAPLFAAYPENTAEAIHEVHYEREPRLTFYTRYGEVFSMACAAVTGLIVLVRFFLRRRKKAVA